MTQVGGFFRAADNSGARHLKCIQRPSGLFDVGDLLRMSVKKVARKRKYKLEKGSVVKAVVSELKLKQNRPSGTGFKSDFNTVIVLNSKGEPLGSRLVCLGPHELRRKGWPKLFGMIRKSF